MTTNLTASQRDALTAELDRLLRVGSQGLRESGVNALRAAVRGSNCDDIQAFAAAARRAAEIADALAADQPA